MARQTVPPESRIFTAGPHAHADNTHVSTWRAKAIALLRAAFGVIWAIAAWLKWQPPFINSFPLSCWQSPPVDTTPSISG